MNVTFDEFVILVTHHGLTRECREIRRRLAEDGLKFCPECRALLPLADFPSNGSGYLKPKCRRCSWRSRKRGTGYIPIASPARTAEATRLYAAKHPDRVRACKLTAYRTRRASGMSSHEASWQKRSAGTA